MNKSKIEWCDSTWNPVTGCEHGCNYCYAKRITNRFGGSLLNGHLTKRQVLERPQRKENGDIDAFPYGFKPTLHKYRLNEPMDKKKSSRIFVVSMGDLFGDWVPDEWIKDVFATCETCKQHTFLFLTKNPQRYVTLLKTYGSNLFPNNAILGASGGTRDLLYKARDAFKILHDNNYEFGSNINTFYSIEPLHEDVTTHMKYDYENGQPFDWCDWVIVGAQTGQGAKPPQKEWVQNIIDQCRVANVPVFLKDNLNWREKIQEFPEVQHEA